MKRKHLIVVGILSICLFASSCGNNTVDTEQSAETIVDTQTMESQEVESEEVELSKLEKKIEEFKNNTSSEILFVQK